MGHRKPSPYLLDKYEVRRGTEPPLLHYGFALQVGHVVRYAKKHDLLDKRCGDNFGLTYVAAIPAFLDHLELATGVRLHFNKPYSCDYRCMVSLYSNYTKIILKLEDKEEKDVLRILKEELELGQDEEPLWWFDKNI